MFCVISLENLNGLIKKKKDDTTVKKMKSVSTPIKFNLV